ncbi:MAG TPA: hypothetical protein VGK27_12945 [Candidatus Deferrimicrobiaceae bacterium]
MSSMSLAITGAYPTVHARIPFPGPGSVLPYADPRAIGISSSQTPPSVQSGVDATSISESIQDRVTLSTRVRRPPTPERAIRRKQPLATPTTRTPVAQTLSEMADAVADRVTFSGARQADLAGQAVYARNGLPAGNPAGEPSQELDALATDITDQVTVSSGGSPPSPGPAEIEIYLSGRKDTDQSPAREFTRLSPLPAGA